jgi:hypothetical protein
MIEARVPLSNLFSASPGAIPLPTDVLAQIQTGQLELRGRIEYNRAARVLRIFQFIVPRGTPLPLPTSPALNASNVGMATDLHIDDVRWHEFEVRSTGQKRTLVMIMGRTLSSYSSTGPGEGETGLVSFGFETDNPSRFNFVTIHYPGEVTAVIQDPSGFLRIERPRLPLGPQR